MDSLNVEGFLSRVAFDEFHVDAEGVSPPFHLGFFFLAEFALDTFLLVESGREVDDRFFALQPEQLQELELVGLDQVLPVDLGPLGDRLPELLVLQFLRRELPRGGGRGVLAFRPTGLCAAGVAGFLYGRGLGLGRLGLCLGRSLGIRGRQTGQWSDRQNYRNQR